MLYQFQWGYRKAGRSLEEYIVWARKELRPTLKRMLGVCKQQDILIPQAVYGFWPANAEGNDVILYDPETQEREVARFTRSEEHTSELQSLMRISYAVFCLKKKTAT